MENVGKLLVVDDNEMNRDLLSRRLAREGFEVEMAESGAAALAKCDEGRYDLILLDIMMPEISGVEVLRQLRERHSQSDLPIIMATAKDDSKDVVESLEAGANDYVTKPLDFPVVLARVRTQLSLKHASDAVIRLEKSLAQLKRPSSPSSAHAAPAGPADPDLDEIRDAWGKLSIGAKDRILEIVRWDEHE